MSAVYNHGMSIEPLKDSVDKLTLPIDIEALNDAVEQSDAVDPSTALPDLAGPEIRPKPKNSKREA